MMSLLWKAPCSGVEAIIRAVLTPAGSHTRGIRLGSISNLNLLAAGLVSPTRKQDALVSMALVQVLPEELKSDYQLTKVT